MILYFTGTGNSRYLAQKLAKLLNDTVVDVAESIKAGEHPTFVSEKPYIFVSPVYAWRLPRLFGQWIRTCRFEGNKKAYFLLNCGSEIGAAGKYIEPLCADMNFTCMGTAEIVMPENYIVMFSAPAPEEDAGILAKAAAKTAELAVLIATEAPLDRKKLTPLDHLMSGIVNSCFYTFTIGAKKFYATDACISCGRCADNCMLNNITFIDGKPVWGRDCTHCMACICKCPTEAIEYGKHTKGLRRYVCPKEENEP